jgi:hypothetical protein
MITNFATIDPVRALSFDPHGGAALPPTSLCDCMDFAVRAAYSGLKDNKVMLLARAALLNIEIETW